MKADRNDKFLHFENNALQAKLMRSECVWNFSEELTSNFCPNRKAGVTNAAASTVIGAKDKEIYCASYMTVLL